MLVGGERNGPKNRRRGVRIGGPALSAVYWTGGRGEPLHVRDISAGGAYIETKASWFVGTVVHLMLQCGGTADSAVVPSFGIWARVVRAEPGGMGVEFLILGRKEEKAFRKFLATVPLLPRNGAGPS